MCLQASSGVNGLSKEYSFILMYCMYDVMYVTLFIIPYLIMVAQCRLPTKTQYMKAPIRMQFFLERFKDNSFTIDLNTTKKCNETNYMHFHNFLHQGKSRKLLKKNKVGKVAFLNFVGQLHLFMRRTNFLLTDEQKRFKIVSLSYCGSPPPPLFFVLVD